MKNTSRWGLEYNNDRLVCVSTKEVRCKLLYRESKSQGLFPIKVIKKMYVNLKHCILEFRDVHVNAFFISVHVCNICVFIFIFRNALSLVIQTYSQSMVRCSASLCATFEEIVVSPDRVMSCLCPMSISLLLSWIVTSAIKSCPFLIWFLSNFYLLTWRIYGNKVW